MNKSNEPIVSPLNRDKLPELVVAQIKELIFSNSIAVGEKLPSERDLAEQFKISRTMVREALNSLAHAGLLEIRRGRSAGAYVVDNLHKPLFHSTVNMIRSGRIGVREFIGAREAIECYGLRQAIGKITEEDLKRLEEDNEEFHRQSDRRHGAMDANARFHLTLSQLSGNQLLTTMLHSLLDLMAEKGFQNAGGSSFRMKAYKAHTEIVEAIRQRDWDLAEQLLAKNIDQTKELHPKSPDGKSNDSQEASGMEIGKRLKTTGKKHHQ
jgi:GntR family transcriptional repressor for pyruvate dehydrogenase complex